MDGALAFDPAEVEAMVSEAHDAIDLHLEQRSGGVSRAEFWAIIAKAYTYESDFDETDQRE